MTELPQWKCHKTVRAAKITTILDGGELVLEGEITVKPGLGWINKHHPDVGQYFVDDSGRQSVWNAPDFEGEYARTA